MTSLFRISHREVHLFPASINNAMQLATRILRSDFHKSLLCGLWPEPDKDGSVVGEPHINMELLNKVLEQQEIFVLDKIRLLDFSEARACTQRETDPFKIFLHPMMLLEMMDREREETELNAKEISVFDNLLDPVSFFKEDGRTLNTDHTHTDLNSMVYIWQTEERLKKRAVAAKARAAAAKQQAEARDKAAAATKPTGLRTLKPSALEEEEVEAPVSKKAKIEAKPVASTMSNFEKDTLMLTLLLVHETQHLLMYGLSSALVKGKTPKKKFIKHDSAYFDNVGHFMERSLYGFSVNHAFSPHYMTPFGIDELVGSIHQHGKLEYIMEPCATFKLLLSNPALPIDIEEKTINLESPGDQEYKAPRKTVRMGRASERPSGSESGGEEGSEDEELYKLFPEPTITKGRT